MHSSRKAGRQAGRQVERLTCSQTEVECYRPPQKRRATQLRTGEQGEGSEGACFWALINAAQQNGTKKDERPRVPVQTDVFLRVVSLGSAVILLANFERPRSVDLQGARSAANA